MGRGTYTTTDGTTARSSWHMESLSVGDAKLAISPKTANVKNHLPAKLAAGSPSDTVGHPVNMADNPLTPKFAPFIAMVRRGPPPDQH